MQQVWIQYAVWMAAITLLSLILIVLYRRDLHREFQVFFWYTAAHLADALVSFIVRRISDVAYFYVYWGWEAFDAIFTLIVLQIVFMKIFDSYSSLRNLGLTVFRCATLAFCVFALLTALYTPGSGDDQLTRGVLVMEGGIQLVQVGLLLCIFSFSRLLGLAWRHYIYGIILGFGLTATITLVEITIRTKLGPNFHHFFRWTGSFAYICGLLTWLYYFTAERSARVSSHFPESDQLLKWNEALSGILRK